MPETPPNEPSADRIDPAVAGRVEAKSVFRAARRLFESLVDAAPDERRAALAAAAAGDPGLAALVADMLAADDADLGPRTGGGLQQAVHLLAAEAEAADVPDDPEDLGGRTAGAWRIGERLGRGGMGVVHAADRSDGRYAASAAVKVLDAVAAGRDGPARFRRERTVLARVEHPGIVRILDAEELEDGRPWFVMDRVEGGRPITTWAAETGVSRRERVRRVLEAAEAVAAAHRGLVVHRDLKPGNVLVDAEDRVRLVDFGIARRIGAETGDRRPAKTRAPGRGAGPAPIRPRPAPAGGPPGPDGDPVTAADAPSPHTPGYAAPEQWAGGAVDVRVDVHGLGVILQELLLGRRPARADDVAGLPADLAAVVRRARAADPADRYPDVPAFAADLQAWLDHRPVAARPVGPVRRTLKLMRRHRGPAAAIAIVGLTLLVGVTGVVESRQRAVRARESADLVRGYVADMLRSPRLEEDGFEVRVVDLLDQARDDVADRFPTRPDLRAEILELLGESYLSLGRVDASIDAYRRGVSAADAAFGPTDPLPIATRLGLGVALLRAGDVGGSLEASTAVVERLEATGETGSSRYLAALNNVANGCRRSGDLDGCRRRLEDVLRVRTAIHGPDDEGLLPVRHNLGAVLQELGHLDAADAMAADVVAACTRYGPDDPRTLWSMQSLLVIRADRADWPGCEAIGADLLARQRRTLPPGDVGIAFTLGTLGSVSRERGELVEAERRLVEALEIADAAPGRPLIRTTARRDLVLLLLADGRPKQAGMEMDRLDAATRDEPAAWRAARGIDTARGEVLLALGRRDEARTVLSAAAEAAARHLAPDHRRHGEIATILGALQDRP